MAKTARFQPFTLSILAKRGGQATVEYILILSIAAAVMGVLTFGFRQALGEYWATLACEIAAPCPTCNMDQAMASRANQFSDSSACPTRIQGR